MGASIHARTASPGNGEPSIAAWDPDPTALGDADPEDAALDGALLLDLEDDADAETRAELSRLIDDAMRPFDWPDGELGEALSAPAGLYRLQVPASELADLRAALRGREGVESLEREHVVRLPEPEGARVAWGETPGRETEAEGAEPARGEFRPNDPYYKHQWHLDQIQMPSAWARTRGRGVVVAVIDTGVLYRDHASGRQAPDLAGTRFVDGWDFVDQDNTPDDEHGHGTHVAGTVAQATDNGVGVAGVAPEASIMALRVLDARGTGRSGDIAAAIRWAADHGAHVINMSLGGGRPTRATQAAIRYAHARGVVVVAAAGNTGRGRVEYPAAHEHVIAVGAVRADGTRAYYSSYGEGLDIAAPGGDLRVDQNGDGMPDGVVQNTMVRGDPMRHDYLGFQGTSMASPHVAGVAALLRAQGVTDPNAIERMLLGSAREAGVRSEYGAGIVQADDALRELSATRGLGGAGGAGLALVVLLGFGRRRRERLAVGPLGAATGAFAVGGGLAAAVAALPGLGSLSGQLGLQGVSSLGPWPALFALSILLPTLCVGLLASVRGAKTGLVALCFGVAGHLALEALLPSARIALLPEVAIGPWLLLQGAALVWMGWAVAQRDTVS